MNYLLSPNGLTHLPTGDKRTTQTGLVIYRTECGRWIGTQALSWENLTCTKCFNRKTDRSMSKRLVFDTVCPRCGGTEQIERPVNYGRLAKGEDRLFHRGSKPTGNLCGWMWTPVTQPSVKVR